MKKTIQSILTAAVFSAAVTSSLSASAQESALAKTALPMAPLYGPPPVDRYLGDIYMDDEIDVRDLSKLKNLLLENDLKVELGEIGDPDRDGRIQMHVSRDNVGQEEYQWFKKYDIGDILGVVQRGTVLDEVA